MAYIDVEANLQQNKKLMKKKIFYFEGNVDGTVGGSYYLMYDLVTNLDSNKYCPIVGFYKDNILVQKLKAEGIEVKLFNRPKPFVLKNTGSDSSIPKRLVWLFLKGIQRSINIFRRLIIPAFQFKRYLKNESIDLVNLNNSIMRNHEWILAAKFAGVKCITHEMGINKTFSWSARYFGSYLKAIISLSYAITDNMRKCGIKFPFIHTIHCGIDLGRYKINETPEELRKKYGITKNDPVIGVVGNVKYWKGQETVVKAVKDIKKEISNIRCVLVGGSSETDMPYRLDLEKFCAQEGIEKNVIFAGFQENPIDYMNMFNIVIHSSIEPEPFGIVNLEAMSVKKPIISTTIGAPAEIYENGKSAILVNPGNAAELANACIMLLKDKEKSTKMGLAAYERLHNCFTLERNIRDTQKIYESIIT